MSAAETREAQHHARNLATELAHFFRDIFGSLDEPLDYWCRYRHHKIIVKWGWGLGNYSTLTVAEAEAYLEWLEAGNLGGPHKMETGA